MARYKQITFRVDDFERYAIQAAAEASRRREGDFIRLLVLESIGYEPPVDHPDYSAPRGPMAPKAKKEKVEEPETAGDFEFDEDGYVDVKPVVTSDVTVPCAECDHPKGAHMSSPQLGDRCMICPPNDESLHTYQPKD